MVRERGPAGTFDEGGGFGAGRERGTFDEGGGLGAVLEWDGPLRGAAERACAGAAATAGLPDPCATNFVLQAGHLTSLPKRRSSTRSFR